MPARKPRNAVAKRPSRSRKAEAKGEVQHARGERAVPASAAPSLTEGKPKAPREVTPVSSQHQSRVFVLDRHGKPLMPCHPARARQLLAKGRARVHRLTPFVIRLIDRTVDQSALQPVEILLDPGSKTTGLAIVRTSETVDQTTGEIRTDRHVLHLAEVTHRGAAVRDVLTSRAAFRRGRRSRSLRYRAPRFDNRVRPQGWLPPSLRSRADNVEGWTRRFQRWAPLVGAQVETVRFDTQALERPGIAGAEYQQGDLAGYEVREFLLERDGRRCAYCDAEHVPLQVEHVVARARGGSDRTSNLTLACDPCNQAKGSRPIEEFLARDPERLKRIKARLKISLRDAAAVNATRYEIRRRIAALGLPVQSWSGGRTKWNRSRLSPETHGVPKAHCLDAACVGVVDALHGWRMDVLEIKAMGRGAYQRTRLTKHGFPRGYLMRTKTVQGFRTGDTVKAVVPTGKKAGVHTGRVAVRASGSFNIQSKAGVVQGISHRHCRILARGDGYGYHRRSDTVAPASATKTEGGLSSPA